MAIPLRERAEKLAHDLQIAADDYKAKDEPTVEDAKRLDDMGTELTQAMVALKAQQSAGQTLDASQAFLADLAGKQADQPAPEVHSSGIVNPRGMTLGEAFAKSPAYQEFVSQFQGADGNIRNIPGIKSGEYVVDTKTLVTGLSATSGGAYIQNALLGTTVDLVGERRMTVRDLCTNIRINSDTFEYVTVTSKTNAAAPVLEATTSATPGLNNVAVGAYTAAHGVKPESTLALAVVTSPVETIAHLIPITRRAAADAPQVVDLVNQFLIYGLREEEEDQILNGSGTSPNLRGILQTVGINTVGSAGTDLDAVVDAIAAIRADNRDANAMVVNPADWYSTGFLLAKDSATGQYLLANPSLSIDQQNMLWGLRVVVTPAMTADTVLVGDFRQAVVADRMQATLYVSDSHNDWFARNLLAILAEERLGFGVLDPEAFCTVTAV